MSRFDRWYYSILAGLWILTFGYLFVKAQTATPTPATVDLALFPIPCASERHLPGNPFVIPCPCQ